VHDYFVDKEGLYPSRAHARVRGVLRRGPGAFLERVPALGMRAAGGGDSKVSGVVDAFVESAQRFFS